MTKGQSIAENLVNSRFNVYLLDWGIPGREDRKNEKG